MFHEQFEELKHTGKLPTPSGLGLRILMLTRQEDCSLDEIVQTIQADPALTGRILKLANSALVGSTQVATTAREASVRLGLRTVCNVALGFSLIAATRRGRCVNFDYEGYWAWSLANAVAAQRLSRESSIATPNEAFTCALLARIGRLALASVHPGEYARVLNRLRRDPSLQLASVEREHFCIEHHVVAAAILEDWGLPPFFSEAVLHADTGSAPGDLKHDATEDYLRVLNASCRVADVLVADGARQNDLWPVARDAARGLGLDAEAFQRVYDEIGGEWQQWGALLRVSTGLIPKAKEIEKRARAVLIQEDVKPDPDRPLRILAVDDEPVSLKLLVSHLERKGHEVFTARDGKEALVVALERNPQMVITDWMMPELDGLELCKRLRATDAGRNLYILVLTGRTEEDRVVEAFEAGADDYIAKPWSWKLLLARIRPGSRVIQLQEANELHRRHIEQANAKLSLEKRKFKKASLRDALTDLPNRRSALESLEREWSTSKRSSLPLSLILLDIDHFKKVNDKYGHDVGDVVLRSTAKAIDRAKRRGDTCARLGGEEFLLICPATDAEGAKHLAERVRLAVETNRIETPGYRGSVTVSLGIGCLSATCASIDALLKAADEAVYTAKRMGRNRVALAPGSETKRSA